MINIIKTAIITIIISFISGLLLDYYKNLAPRILCNIGNAMPLEINSRKFCAYIITLINVSNKTIHELTLNIQSSQSNIKITDAKITKGLKFDSSIKDNILDVDIPFLSKNDKFSVTVYVENQYSVHNKPVIVIRSPENFKRIDSAGQNGMLALLFNIPKSIYQGILEIIKRPKEMTPDKKDNFTTVINKPSDAKEPVNKGNREVLYGNKKLSKSKKAIIVTVPIILVMIVGFLGVSYFKGMTANTPNSSVNTAIPNQSTDAAESTGETNKNKSKTESPGYKVTNASAEGSTRNTSANASMRGTTGNTDANTPTRASSENKAANTSAGASSENKAANTSTKTSTGNTDTNISTKSSTENAAANTSTGASSENAATNSAAKTSTGNTAN